MDEAPVSALQASNWRSLCNLAQTHAMTLSKSCLPEFRDPMLGIAQRFTQLPPPKTEEEFNARLSENSCVSCIVGSIAYASKVGTSCLAAQREIYKLARTLAETPLGTPFSDVLSAAAAFTSQVRALSAGP
jgi:hypothetical protein